MEEIKRALLSDERAKLRDKKVRPRIERALAIERTGIESRDDAAFASDPRMEDGRTIRRSGGPLVPSEESRVWDIRQRQNQ